MERGHGAVRLINPNSSAAATVRMAAVLRETLGAGWTVAETTNPDAPPVIVDPPGLARASRSVAALFRDGLDPLDGVVVSAFVDPALEALRAMLAVPVVGIAEAAMAEAARHGRFAILSTTPALGDAIAALAAGYGHGDALAGIVGSDDDPQALMGDPARLAATLAALMERAVVLGAAAVTVGGGPLADAARALARDAPVPVVEPVPAAARALARRIFERRGR